MINLFQSGVQEDDPLPLSIVRKTILMTDDTDGGEVMQQCEAAVSRARQTNAE